MKPVCALLLVAALGGCAPFLGSDGNPDGAAYAGAPGSTYDTAQNPPSPAGTVTYDPTIRPPPPPQGDTITGRDGDESTPTPK